MGGSGECYSVATKILRTPQAIDNDRSLIGDSLLDCEANLFLAQAGKPGGKAALGMFCIFIFNWVTIIVIIKFIRGFAL